MAAYNRVAAAQYALRWALDRNPKYRDFSANTGGGGDCTNFISQALFAGGWTMTGGRGTHDILSWYTSRTVTGLPWVSARAFVQFLQLSRRGNICTEDELDIGDLVSMIFLEAPKPNHWMMVTGFLSGPDGDEPALSYHSHDTINSSLLAVRARGGLDATFQCWSLSDYVSDGDYSPPSDEK